MVTSQFVKDRRFQTPKSPIHKIRWRFRDLACDVGVGVEPFAPNNRTGDGRRDDAALGVDHLVELAGARSFVYAMLASFFLAVFLLKYRIEYLVLTTQLPTGPVFVITSMSVT